MIVRTDIISILDLRFDDKADLENLPQTMPRPVQPSRMLDLMKTSYRWLFYREQLKGFELFEVRPSDKDTLGAAVRLNRTLRIGTYILWRNYRGECDPGELKEAAWNAAGRDLAVLNFENVRCERFYPFVCLNVDTEDIDQYARDNAEDIGRTLTGDLEDERPEALRKYVENDLSLRSYEKLLIRWTEALALYSRMESEQKYEECMFRAAQLFEHCILARVSLLALSSEMDGFLQHLLVMTPGKWLQSRQLLTAFSNIEETFVMHPRVQSVEADRLIRTAGAQFGLSKVLESAKAIQSEFRERVEWAKAQTLGALALCAYLLDKVIGWDNIRKFLLWSVHHVFH